VQKIQAKKTIYDLRFFPILESSRVESQAVKSRNSLNFNDWAKIPDSITLFDKNRRERMFIESGKIGFEIDRNQAIEDRTQEYKSEMMAAYKEFNPEKLHRVALREWFAICGRWLLRATDLQQAGRQVFSEGFAGHRIWHASK